MTRPMAHAPDEIRLPSKDLHEDLAFFTERLGFRLDTIFPADDPTTATISGHGVRIRLDREGNRAKPGDAWVTGRAGMQYRDLVPGRLGGALVASHIRIPHAGPVPDLVHFHDVAFQLIFCHRGFVKVVYEDQGEPFFLREGDCLIQPPRIRHRVLEASDNLEVIEVTAPAEHLTTMDHALTLPTPVVNPGRDFSGQKFCRSEAAGAAWTSGRLPGFEFRETGISIASGGVASVRVARAGQPSDGWTAHNADVLFIFIRSGALTLRGAEGDARTLRAGEASVIPKGTKLSLTDVTRDLEMLEVAMPASFETLMA